MTAGNAGFTDAEFQFNFLIQILQQAQQDPKALQDHMKNPIVREKVQKLIAAGIIRTR